MPPRSSHGAGNLSRAYPPRPPRRATESESGGHPTIAAHRGTASSAGRFRYRANRSGRSGRTFAGHWSSGRSLSNAGAPRPWASRSSGPHPASAWLAVHRQRMRTPSRRPRRAVHWSSARGACAETGCPQAAPIAHRAAGLNVSDGRCLGGPPDPAWRRRGHPRRAPRGHAVTSGLPTGGGPAGRLSIRLHRISGHGRCVRRPLRAFACERSPLSILRNSTLPWPSTPTPTMRPAMRRLP